jgi:L-asparaginase
VAAQIGASFLSVPSVFNPEHQISRTMTTSLSPNAQFTPGVIIHGGAGALSSTSLPPSDLASYRASLSQILSRTRSLLDNGSSALDAAVAAVSLFEDNPLFNCGRGAVFTTDGTIELEASVMVSSVRADVTAGGDGLLGGPKRAAGVMLVRGVRHPIQLAKELLVRRPEEGGGTHCQLSGPYVEGLARKWGLEMKGYEWFWTRKRWEEHLKGLRGETPDVMLPQGTVGAVCLDQWGDLCVATSTGGLTNKKPGRIGDTPTVGAGFWAEAWREDIGDRILHEGERREPDETSGGLLKTLEEALGSCLGMRDTEDILHQPLFRPSLPPPSPSQDMPEKALPLTPPTSLLNRTFSSNPRRRAIAMSGTGNGDSFLRTTACRTAGAIARFSSPASLSTAVGRVAGPGGELQQSAGKRWKVKGEGQGGIIGIEVCQDETEEGDDVDATPKEGKGKARVVFDFNCGGMFRAYVNDNGEAVVGVFRGDDRVVDMREIDKEIGWR